MVGQIARFIADPFDIDGSGGKGEGGKKEKDRMRGRRLREGIQRQRGLEEAGVGGVNTGVDTGGEEERAKARAGTGNYLRCTRHPRTERCCEEDRSSVYRESVYPQG